MFHASHACTVGDLAKNQSADLQSWEKLSEVKRQQGRSSSRQAVWSGGEGTSTKAEGRILSEQAM